MQMLPVPLASYVMHPPPDLQLLILYLQLLILSMTLPVFLFEVYLIIEQVVISQTEDAMKNPSLKITLPVVYDFRTLESKLRS